MLKDKFEMKGKIKEIVPGGEFIVFLENGHTILCHTSGKMIKNSIRLLIGDLVTVEISKYDVSKGRIIFRERKGALNSEQLAVATK